MFCAKPKIELHLEPLGAKHFVSAQKGLGSEQYMYKSILLYLHQSFDQIKAQLFVKLVYKPGFLVGSSHFGHFGNFGRSRCVGIFGQESHQKNCKWNQKNISKLGLIKGTRILGWPTFPILIPIAMLWYNILFFSSHQTSQPNQLINQCLCRSTVRQFSKINDTTVPNDSYRFWADLPLESHA